MMKRNALGWVVGVTCALLSVATSWAQSEPPPGKEMEVKPAKEAGLKPGQVLGKDNWEAAKDLLPPEILRHYKDGEYANKIIDWPQGIYLWDPPFKTASDANHGHYAVSPEGTVIDQATGKQPPFIYGLPF